MNTISMDEILQLYKKAGADPQKTTVIRATLNKGTLGNRLNTGKPRSVFPFSPTKAKYQ
ncbi:hypothetical protein [Faecalibaculum rodentium]|uniref:hypothetical protein n=1 Tax=Faecalibaculum rodentium TaxID=1702221 RepID=UPI0023F52984|nr:hypothetical protein [Faecalibaculum rodentium]